MRFFSQFIVIYIKGKRQKEQKEIGGCKWTEESLSFDGNDMRCPATPVSAKMNGNSKAQSIDSVVPFFFELELSLLLQLHV